MIRKYGLPLLAIFGIGFSLFMIYKGMQQPPVAPILFPPPTSPYKHYIAGEGIIEPTEESIAIGVPFPNLVTNVFVKVGDTVTQGQPLFELDLRQLTANLQEAQKLLDLACIDNENKKIQFSFYQRLCNTNAVSEQAYQNSKFAFKLAQQAVAVAQATVNRIKIEMERSVIRAPFDGIILQSNVSVGEFANVNPFDTKPHIVFGKTSYQLRVDIDEEDVWRVIKGAPATAFVRGNANIHIPLTFAYLEPYIVPKQALSGSNRELVDTRVLQLVYSFKKDNYPIFNGQLLDVYVEAQPSEIAT